MDNWQKLNRGHSKGLKAGAGGGYEPGLELKLGLGLAVVGAVLEVELDLGQSSRWSWSRA